MEAPPRRTPNSNNKADRRLPLTPCCALGDHERSLVTSWKMLPLSWNVERLSRNGRGADEALRISRSPTPSRSRGMDSACSRRTDAASRIGCACLAHRLRLALAEWTPPHSRRTDTTRSIGSTRLAERGDKRSQMTDALSRKSCLQSRLIRCAGDMTSRSSSDMIIWHNGEHVHPLPARGEDELGVDIQTTINVANTAAGSGLHDADCSPCCFI